MKLMNKEEYDPICTIMIYVSSLLENATTRYYNIAINITSVIKDRLAFFVRSKEGLFRKLN